MIDVQVDVDGWSIWLEDHHAIGTKLRGSTRENKEAYFLIIHAATEALFRRIILVGLRLNKVTYHESNEWLYHNDDTPEKTNYPILFNRLYNLKHVTWAGVVQSGPDLDQLWDLWLGYSKIIRNHISHGIRKYGDDWLHSGIVIDQELLMRLDKALMAIIGGSVCSNLDKLSPRLPKGTKGADLGGITGRKKRKPRPQIALANAKYAIERLTART